MTTDILSGSMKWKLPRRFHLMRNGDISGVSGPETFAEGAVWSSGAVALHWPGYPQATSVWASIREVLEIHGHGDTTEIIWLDAGDEIRVAVLDQPEQPKRDSKGWPIMKPGSCTGAGG